MGGVADGRRSNWQDGRVFAHVEQKIRIARDGFTERHMEIGDKSVTPALRALPPSNAPRVQPEMRHDVRHARAALASLARISAIQPKREGTSDARSDDNL